MGRLGNVFGASWRRLGTSCGTDLNTKKGSKSNQHFWAEKCRFEKRQIFTRSYKQPECFNDVGWLSIAQQKLPLVCLKNVKFSQKPIKSLWCVVRTSWERLESVWRRLGASWDRLESVLEHLGASWAVLETSSERLGNVLERRSVPILIRKKAQNQTNIFWPKNVGLKKRQAQNQTNIFWPKMLV